MAMMYSGFILEILACLVVLVSLSLIYKNSERPGRFMMLFGYLFYLISFVPVYVSLFVGGEHGYGSLLANIIYYSPIASSMFLCVVAGGVLLFAQSFKNES